MRPEPTMIAQIQHHALEDDWVVFNRHFFLQCAGVNPARAAEIASISLTYEIDRLFNIYARGLKRMRKQGQQTMVMNCDSDFNLLISHEVVSEIPEEGSYPFRSLAEVAKESADPVGHLFLLARVVSSFVELVNRKKAEDFEKSVSFGVESQPVLLPRDACIFVRPEGDPFEGADAMKTPEQQLFHAVAMNDEERVFSLLDSGIDLNIRSPQGANLLFEALGYVHFKLALSLIDRGIRFSPKKLAAELETLPPRPEEEAVFQKLMAHAAP